MDIGTLARNGKADRRKRGTNETTKNYKLSKVNGKRGEDEQRWRMGRRILKINTLKEEDI